jgi:hypothetical protein
MPRHPARPSLRRIARLLVVVLALAAGAAILWPVAPPMLRALPEAFRLSRLPPASEVLVPVAGVPRRSIADTWGAPRAGGRRHEGTDIFAARGTPVRSATRGIVLRIGETGIGGRQAWVLGPGNERPDQHIADAMRQKLEAAGVVSLAAAVGAADLQLLAEFFSAYDLTSGWPPPRRARHRLQAVQDAA